MPPGPENPRDLAERLRGLARVLENLGAEHDVERRVGDLELLHGTDVRDVRTRLDVRPDVLLGEVGEERVVGHVAAADVEDPRGRRDVAIARGRQASDERAVVEVVGVDEARSPLPALRPGRLPLGKSQVGHPRRPYQRSPTTLARDAAASQQDYPRAMRFPTAIALGAAVVTAAASGSAGMGSPAPLTWAPPALSNPVVVTVTNANRRLFLDNSRDYRLNIVEHLNRELWIEGGRNVVVVGGHITVDQLGGSTRPTRTTPA